VRLESPLWAIPPVAFNKPASVNTLETRQQIAQIQLFTCWLKDTWKTSMDISFLFEIWIRLYEFWNFSPLRHCTFESSTFTWPSPNGHFPLNRSILVWRPVWQQKQTELIVPSAKTVKPIDQAIICICVVANGRAALRDWWISAHPYYLHRISIPMIFHLNECIAQNATGPATIPKKLMMARVAEEINAPLFNILQGRLPFDYRSDSRVYLPRSTCRFDSLKRWHLFKEASDTFPNPILKYGNERASDYASLGANIRHESTKDCHCTSVKSTLRSCSTTEASRVDRCQFANVTNNNWNEVYRVFTPSQVWCNPVGSVAPEAGVCLFWYWRSRYPDLETSPSRLTFNHVIKCHTFNEPICNQLLQPQVIILSGPDNRKFDENCPNCRKKLDSFILTAWQQSRVCILALIHVQK
jgi:hypothetical protein